ncbi:MAG: large subunit ribosomal protein L25 [bacterium]|jgi:large subunit ribosomal protein L25
MDFTVQQRDNAGKGVNRKLRAEGLNSGILYGKNEPIKISMNTNKTVGLLRTLQGVVKTINLTVENESGSENKQVIVQDYQLNNMGNALLHVDFREVEESTVIKINVPVVPVGTPEALQLGASLQLVRYNIPVKTTVAQAPASIEVDVSEMEVNTGLRIDEVQFPEGVTPILKGGNYTVITLAGRRAIEDEDEDGAPGAAVAPEAAASE